jgi:hypothetical protein
MKTEFFDRYGIRLLMIPLLSVCVSCSMGAVVTPPFDTSVIASSSVANIQNVAYESHLGSTLIGEDENVPAAVKYSVSITGANRTDGQGAEGIARTRFVVSVLEGRDTDLNASSEHVWRDNTEVAGTIRNLMKNFEYKSGMRI